MILVIFWTSNWRKTGKRQNKRKQAILKKALKMRVSEELRKDRKSENRP